MPESYTIKEEVRIFPRAGGWHYVAVPQSYTDALKPLAERGLVAVRATVGNSSWDTSLLPMGDGSQFIPLPAAVRRKENITIGNVVELSFVARYCLGRVWRASTGKKRTA